MTDEPWTFSTEQSGDPIIVTAIHAGHALRDDVARLTVLDAADRRREEDPYTDRWTTLAGTRGVAHRSRFEFDLNRPRDRAIYRKPEDAWGLVVWSGDLPDAVADESLALYDSFYVELGQVCDDLVGRVGRFVLFDLHSYNHHRAGHDAPAADPDENPEVNIGTGSITSVSWRPIVEVVIAAMSEHPFDGGHLDVRENVKFTGGTMCRWVNQRYGADGCAIAIEMKKIFMDEWTGVLDETAFVDLGGALESAAQAVRRRLGGDADS